MLAQARQQALACVSDSGLDEVQLPGESHNAAFAREPRQRLARDAGIHVRLRRELVHGRRLQALSLQQRDDARRGALLLGKRRRTGLGMPHVACGQRRDAIRDRLLQHGVEDTR